MKTEQKIIAVLAWCMMFVFACMIAMSVYLQGKMLETMVVRKEMNADVEAKLIEYMNGQIEYYEYNLEGLKAWDEEKK